MLRHSHAGRDQLRIGRLLGINRAGTRCVAVVSRVTNRGGAGLSHPLLKFSDGSVDDYATIPDDSSSPS